MSNKKRINNSRFSIRFVHMAEAFSLTTVGQVHSFLRNIPGSFRLGNTRAAKLQRELRIYLRVNQL